MLSRRQVFVTRACWMRRYTGLMDRRCRRVHMGEQVGRRGLARFAEVDHIAGPLGVAFVAVACFEIVGRFDALGGRRLIRDWSLKRTGTLGRLLPQRLAASSTALIVPLPGRAATPPPSATCAR